VTAQKVAGTQSSDMPADHVLLPYACSLRYQVLQMDEWGFLSVIVSIILGLSITQLLQGISELINERERVRFYWPAVGWGVLLLLIDVQAWWAMFGLRHRHSWTFLQFATVLLEVILLYLVAALALPNFAGQAVIDLRANYFKHRTWFFGCLVLVLVDSLLKAVVIGGELPGAVDLAFHLIWLGSASVAAITRSDWYHKANLCLTFVLVVIYIAILFTTLR
jgi:hypothetical protein